MDDAADRAIEGLKIQIKKEIVDNFFADRVYLEEDSALLCQETEAYRAAYDSLGRRFLRLCQALGTERACNLLAELLRLQDWPPVRQFEALSAAERQELLKEVRRRGFTAYRRFRNLVFDLYQQLQQEGMKLQDSYDKIKTHIRLLNEDIDKFNLSYDFGLIAAQIEGLEGRGEAISGGLLGPEREELSTRMRFKRCQVKEEELPRPPDLPPLPEIKDRLTDLVERVYLP